MELYFRFLGSLAAGLFGVSIVLKVLLDGIFNEWDVVADAQDYIQNGRHHKNSASIRAEDIMMEAENAKVVPMSTRMYEQKRQDLEKMSQVEQRVHLTPIAPPAPEIVAS